MRKTSLAPALALALVLVLVAPTGHAASVPRIPQDPTQLLVHDDFDGNRSLTLDVEDGVGGTFAYTSVKVAQAPDTKEGGVFAHTWARGATPMLTLGTYFVSQSQKTVREPLVIFENVSSQAEAQALLLAFAGTDTTQLATNLQPFLTEFLLPEGAGAFLNYPAPGSTSTYHDYPTLFAWTLHRSTPAGEQWAGAYLVREGSSTASGVAPFHGEKLVEIGSAVRTDGATLHAAGVYVQSVIDANEPGSATETLTVGASAAEKRVPLATFAATDGRFGPDPVMHPDGQSDTLTLGVHDSDGNFVPVLGAETTIAYAAYGENPDGTTKYDVTRVTSLGPYVLGTYTPLAGFRYHSDAGDALATERELGIGGPGADGLGDFETDVGFFNLGVYQPVAGAVHRSSFPGMVHTHASLVAVGAYGPFGFEGVLAVSYDGTESLLSWVRDLSTTSDASEGWRIAAGAYLAGSYEPLVGVDERPQAPGGTAAYEREVIFGVFVADYRSFVPVGSVVYEGAFSPAQWATKFATGGAFGAPTGGMDARVGAYGPTGGFVPLAGVEYRDHFDGSTAASSSALVLGVYGPDGAFVPLAGLVYWGDTPFQQSLASAGNTRDDKNANLALGVFVQGAFVPLVTVHNDGNGTSVTAGPALPV